MPRPSLRTIPSTCSKIWRIETSAAYCTFPDIICANINSAQNCTDSNNSRWERKEDGETIERTQKNDEQKRDRRSRAERRKRIKTEERRNGPIAVQMKSPITHELSTTACQV